MRRFVPVLAVLAALVLPGAPAQAQAFTDAQKEELGRMIRDYILKNPEIVQEAMTELDRRNQVAEAAKRKEKIRELAPKLFESPRAAVIGNPQGDITVVEFFDYNCGFCKRSLPDLVDLIKGDGKLRVVLKEMPVLGPGSVEAAQVAVAVKLQTKGAKYFEFHQKLMARRGPADKAAALAVAREIGLDMARLERDLENAEVRATLEESLILAEALGINGTPSYVIGEEVVVGAVGFAKLQETIKEARRCRETTC
jgi:protein-disulfide isomerase